MQSSLYKSNDSQQVTCVLQFYICIRTRITARTASCNEVANASKFPGRFTLKSSIRIIASFPLLRTSGAKY